MSEQEVIRKTLDLLETMEEGLTYIKEKLKELNIEVTMPILADTINAFSTIEESANSFLKDATSGDMAENTDKLRKAFNFIVEEYENDRGQKALEIMQLTLEPAFKSWKAELERVLRPYIIS